MTNITLPDIKPQTPIATIQRDEFLNCNQLFDLDKVCRVIGMSKTFIRKICGSSKSLNSQQVLMLLDQDSYSETFVPRSKILGYLINSAIDEKKINLEELENQDIKLVHSNVLDYVQNIPKKSIKCIVTSPPYWGMRIYKDSTYVSWADGETCPFGHEQTPDAYIRHTTQILDSLFDILADDGSIWWNVMDTFNTRTQIRSNASEALKAMQGNDERSWGEYECRRYSAGHSYLKDGEQCLIPFLIAKRASQLGFYVKTMITWAKTSSMPEPQNSRVSRNLEYIIHLTKQRTPLFNKDIYKTLPAELGGKTIQESEKLSDVWTLPTSSGRDGHGAQFPIALPARCIALSTHEEDFVLDPFVGAGNTGVAAKMLKRKFIGIDVCKEYLAIANDRIKNY